MHRYEIVECVKEQAEDFCRWVTVAQYSKQVLHTGNRVGLGITTESLPHHTAQQYTGIIHVSRAGKINLNSLKN
jgi:hypothetical protein